MKRPLKIVFGGCGFVSLCLASVAICLVMSVTANAIYWSNVRRPNNIIQVSSSTGGTSSLEALPPGNANAGAEIFNGSGSCHACHSLTEGVQVIGPSLAGVADRAATRSSAELYLYESIVSPDAYIVGGFQSGLMPPNFGQQLSDQELVDLIAFLLTQ